MAPAKSSPAVELALDAQKRARELFMANRSADDEDLAVAKRTRLAAKIAAEYAAVRDMNVKKAAESAAPGPKMLEGKEEKLLALPAPHTGGPGSSNGAASASSTQPVRTTAAGAAEGGLSAEEEAEPTQPTRQLAIRSNKPKLPTPDWHAPWKLSRVISGHLGWVRCVAVDISNKWFATGSADRTIKIWDLASGQLRLTLTGHVEAVRGIAISDRHPYMFTVGADKKVLCWDLEQNKVIRSYFGHLSGVYSVDIHPKLDILVSAGRDSTARVWDMRTRSQIHVLGGHTHPVPVVRCQAAEPQIITGSMDATVRLWDLAAGKARTVLTNHKKGVRALAIHPDEYTFASGSADNVKKWVCPDGKFLHNIGGYDGIINALAVNHGNVLMGGTDDGQLLGWDWKTGHLFQHEQVQVQPGSLDSEAGIYAMAFDRTGSRLITCEADKTIKIWKEDEMATPETHPIEFDPSILRKRY